jgi:hypothetical protein
MEDTSSQQLSEGKMWVTLIRSLMTLTEKPAVLLLACLAFTSLMIHQYVFPPGALLFTEGIKAHDCGQMVWNLWYVNEAITSGHNPYSTSLLFYPYGANLSHHTLAAGFFPLTVVVKKVSDNSVMYPFYAYRIAILVSFTLILFFTLLLFQKLGYASLIAAIPAVGYAFSDFYIEHALHLNHLAGFFIPLNALLIVDLYKKPGLLRAVAASAIAALSIYFTEFTLYIYLGLVLFGVLVCMRSSGRRLLMEKLRLLPTLSIPLSLITFLLAITPYSYYFLKADVIKPKISEASYYSANLAGFFIPNLARTPLYGHIFERLDSRVTVGTGGFEVFVGFVMLLFGIIGFVKAKRRFVTICGFVSLIFFVLSLGPTLKLLNRDTGVYMPYAFLAHVPPFNEGRTPVRFVVIALFFLALGCAEGLVRTREELGRRWGKRTAAMVIAAVLIWSVAEGYAPVTREKPFTPPAGLQRVVPGAVLNLPIVRNDGYAEMLQVFHHQPIATGFLARYSQQQSEQFFHLEKLFAKGGKEFCDGVRMMGFQNIIIAPNYIAPNAGSVVPLRLDKCSLNVIDLRTDAQSLSETYEQRELPERYPLMVYGQPLDLLRPGSDEYLWYGWSPREPSIRWTDRTAGAVIFALDRVQDSTLKMKLGPFLAPNLKAQQLFVKLNDQPVARFELTDPEARLYSVRLPTNLLRPQNILEFDLPDASSPYERGLSNDRRLLGVNVQWIILDIAPPEQ